MNRLFRSIPALTLSAAMLSGTVSAAVVPEKRHAPVDFSQMSPSDFDTAALTQALDELEEMSVSGALDSRTRQTHSRAEQLYLNILDGFDDLYTQYILTMIAYDSDYTDPDAAAAYSASTDQLTVLQDRCLSVLSLLAQSPNADILDQDGEGLADSLAYYQPLTEDERTLFQTETELVSKYEQLLNTDYAQQTMGELYLELVSLRNELAARYGYDNYADYAYENVYGRDYTPREIQTVSDTVKERIVPLLSALGSASPETRTALSDLPVADAETRLDAIEPYVTQLHPELAESFSFLRQYHLYDLDISDTKLPMGYTVELPAYGSAFIFDAPYGDFTDYATLIHEFGHFNNSFHLTERALWTGTMIDVSEIHSQGLELLFTEYAGDLFGELGSAFRWYEIYSVLSGVVEGCLFDEFERTVYASPDLTAEELDQLFLSIADSYGGGYDATDWTEITHLFQSPFYYISYGTSALSALDIWLTSLSDREEGINAYIAISRLDTNATYAEAIRLAGLRDIFDPGALDSLTNDLTRQLSDELGLAFPDLPTDSLLPPAALVAVGLLLIVGLGAVLRRKEKRFTSYDQFD